MHDQNPEHQGEQLLTKRSDLTIAADSVTLKGWHYAGQSERFVGPHGRPAVIMAHGLGATKDSGLQPFAEQFSAAGFDVIAFDYRNLGDSAGRSRQTVSITRQLADLDAVIDYARSLPGVDENRIVVWGASFSGGHVLRVVSQDPRIAAAIALTPFTDGVAASLLSLRHTSIRQLVKLSAWALWDTFNRVVGRQPKLVPLFAPPGQMAMITTPDAIEKFTSIAGPTWRNEVSARTVLEVGRYSPVARGDWPRVPTLIQVADFDDIASTPAAIRAAVKCHAQVRHYPCNHLDVYPGLDWFDAAVGDQLLFLEQQFGGVADQFSCSAEA